MPHDAWKSLIDNLPVLIFLTLVFGGGFFAAIIKVLNTVITQRHDRKVTAEARKHQLERLRLQKEIAIASGEAISLLVVDDDFARDFQKRLNAALKKQAEAERQGSGVRVVVDGEVPPGHEGEEKEVDANASKPRRARR